MNYNCVDVSLCASVTAVDSSNKSYIDLLSSFQEYLLARLPEHISV